MKKYKLILLFLVAMLFSCEGDFLDLIPDNVATIDNAFTNKNAAKKVLYTCYGYLPRFGSKTSDPSILSGDEIAQPVALNNLDGVQISKGFRNANNVRFDRWGYYYQAIRNCNLFLSRIDEVQDLETFRKDRWVAEVKFLKAYYHFYLARMYGPIIINDINAEVTEGEERLAPERQSIDEVFTFVLNLMDEAIAGLPKDLPLDEYGRITKAGAAAIKARIAMTYASPLFNGNPNYSRFVNSEGKPFFPAYDEAKWTNAVRICKEAIDLCDESGLRLYDIGDYRPRNPQSDITILKSALRGRVTDPWNAELIWGTAEYHGAQVGSMAKFIPFPAGVYPIQRNRAPTLRMAELYYSKNGVPINEDDSFDFDGRYGFRTASVDDQYFVEPTQTTIKLHFDREPRFYADLGFDRGTWFGNGKTGTDEANYFHGRFAELGAKNSNDRYTITGYLPKKLVNIESTISSLARFSQTRYPFPVIRLADLYLYYAEALNETGDIAEAQVWVDKIRSRAGLQGVLQSWANFSTNPSKPTTKKGMRSIIQQERLIEMAFEGRRFWDLRRWLRLKDEMNKPIKGWNVLGVPETNDDKDILETYFQLKIINGDKFSNFSEKDYLWPFAQTEIINIKSLQQNPGW